MYLFAVLGAIILCIALVIVFLPKVEDWLYKRYDWN